MKRFAPKAKWMWHCPMDLISSSLGHRSEWWRRSPKWVSRTLRPIRFPKTGVSLTRTAISSPFFPVPFEPGPRLLRNPAQLRPTCARMSRTTLLAFGHQSANWLCQCRRSLAAERDLSMRYGIPSEPQVRDPTIVWWKGGKHHKGMNSPVTSTTRLRAYRRSIVARIVFR